MIKIIFTVLIYSVVSLAASAGGRDNRPNMILIVTDDQGWWELGAHGNEVIDTPALDRFHKESVSFSHYYAAPVCSPTRAGIMTGRYHLRTGLYNTRFGGDVIDRSEVTLAELLREEGYRTGLFGKWHLGSYFGYQPAQRGFDEFFGHYPGHIEEYDYPDQLVHNGKPVEARKYVTDLFTDAAIEFIEQERNLPFFCYLAYNAPHSPWVVGTSHSRQARGDNLITKYLDRGLSLKDARIYAMVEIIDENLAKLFSRLKELNLDKNTVVIFSSDNGGVSSFYNAGLRGRKGSVYEGGVRAPLMVRWPGRFPAGAKVDAMVSHVDLLPTLCELAGARLPTGRKLDGKSLVPLLKKGGGDSPHQYVYHHWDRYFPNPYNTWAICDGRYKLLNSPSPWPKKPVRQPEPFGQLYDLQNDPSEKTDLSEKHPDIVKRLRTAFLAYYEDVTRGRTYRPVPIPVGNAEENPVEIQPSWATLHGDSIRYTFLGYDWDSVDAWEIPGEQAEWQLDITRGGRYEVIISYGCANKSAGGRLRIAAGGSSIEFVTTATPTPDVFEVRTVGHLDLSPGNMRLTAEVVQAKGGELMKLNKIWLKKI